MVSLRSSWFNKPCMKSSGGVLEGGGTRKDGASVSCSEISELGGDGK